MTTPEQAIQRSIDLAAEVEFPLVWDNTMRNAFVSCERLAWYQFFHHITVDKPSVDLHTGACFAATLEEIRTAFYGEGLSIDASMARGIRRLILEWSEFDPGENSVKTLESTMTAVNFYFSRYPLGVDPLEPLKNTAGKPLVEFNFAIPIPEVLHPVTGEPLIYCGRFDMIAKHRDHGLLFGVDEKTTKQLGASWATKWVLWSQFTGYTWAARIYGYPLDGFVVRGISFLKNGHDTQSPIVYREQWKVDVWYRQLIIDLNRAIEAWKRRYFSVNLGETCSHYGGCSFMKLCDSPTPQDWVSYFKYRKWEPLIRQKGGEVL